jgi:hypothetical protein
MELEYAISRIQIEIVCGMLFQRVFVGDGRD